MNSEINNKKCIQQMLNNMEGIDFPIVRNMSFYPEWISIKDRQPEKDGRYLVVENHGYRWVGVCQMRNGKFDMDVAHWMPLPEAPNE